MDPVDRQAATLAALDRKIARAGIISAAAGTCGPELNNAAASFERDLDGLRGRRSILVRHAPEVGVNDLPYCFRCAGQWPCPDWRDAAAGLEVPDA